MREVFTFHSVEELGVLDETSKDFDSLKGGFGYSLRGTVCSAHDQALLHMSVRTSCLVLHTVQEGFLDWAIRVLFFIRLNKLVRFHSISGEPPIP